MEDFTCSVGKSGENYTEEVVNILPEENFEEKIEITSERDIIPFFHTARN